MIVKRPRILVTGATGYVGGRLVPRLLDQGYSVRVLARDPNRLEGRAWLSEVELVTGDVLDESTLPSTLVGMDIAYYLVHSMSSAMDFTHRDIYAAENFGRAAKDAGVKRIIYLGGLGNPESNLSPHLRSRQVAGEKLKKSGIPVTEFRAAVIVGSGSASFEMLRYVTERVPIIVCPRWVYTRCQPIGISDILEYLIQAITESESTGKIIEIGGKDILTYAELFKGYAAVRGLRRYLIPIPFSLPRVFAYLSHWATPVPETIVRALIEGLRNEVVVKDHLAKTLFPEIDPLDYKTAVKRALDALDANRVESTWSDSIAASLGDVPVVTLGNIEGMISETRHLKVNATPGDVFQVITSLGGKNGWLYANGLWIIRGILDLAVGGVGMRRGRRHPTEIRIGDPLDFYRVEALEPNKLMRLRVEMKVPGKAWMEFKVKPLQDGTTQLTQMSYFAPKGLFGHLYWYALYPFHSIVLAGLISAIGSRAETG